MSTPSRHARDHRDDEPLSAIFQELDRVVPAPDLTGPVMSRLGLSRVSPRAARRRRISRGVARLALVAVAVGASALCVQWHQIGAKSARPAGPTIPSAIRHDLEHHGKTIDRAIRSIRGLSPWRPVSSPLRPLPTSPDHDETTDEDPEQQAPIASRWV
ncbi:MAG: hypothetical protein ACYS15_09400 [Planctomycetota bacterium]|jgi:hypothetical protein